MKPDRELSYQFQAVQRIASVPVERVGGGVSLDPNGSHHVAELLIQQPAIAQPPFDVDKILLGFGSDPQLRGDFAGQEFRELAKFDQGGVGIIKHVSLGTYGVRKQNGLVSFKKPEVTGLTL